MINRLALALCCLMALSGSASAQIGPNSGGGSGTVGSCSTSGGNAYYSGTGTTITCSTGIVTSNTALTLGSGVTLTLPDGETWTNSGLSGPLNITLGTTTTNIKGVNITTTWNNAGTTFDAPLFVNVTNTASNANSLLADLQVGGVSRFNVSVNGVITAAGNFNSTFASASSVVSTQSNFGGL